jgi:major membrane immunogen (membrane-anchored lipoprotein)
MVDDKNKSSVDDASGKERACKVIVGGGEVVGQEKKGNNDDGVVAAAVYSTAVDHDHSGGVGGPVIGPETKGNVTVADAMVDDKNKSSVDDVSGKERTCKVMVGGGEVVGQEKKGGTDDVVVAAAVDSTSVDDDHYGGGGGPVVGPEMRGKDDVADAMVDDKNRSSVDDVSGKEFDSNEIERMQNNMRKSLLKRRYKEVWAKITDTNVPPLSIRILRLM